MSATTVKHATLRNGLTLPYAETGDPGETPIVFVHAYVESWRYFENVLELLPPSMHGYAPSQRGHGPPDRPGDSYRPEDFADDIEAFMSAVGLERPVLVGASSGGLVCQFLAAAHPDRVRALVLISTPASLAGKPSAAGLWQQISALEDPLDRMFVEDFVRATSPGSLPDALVETLVGESIRIPARVWKESLRGLLEAPAPEHGAIRAPTLLVVGDEDVFAAADQEILLSRIPHARLVRYPHSGHSVHLTQPARVVADLVTFLGRSATG